MRRCASCGRAVDDESGVVDHDVCPWCGGELEPDPAGARTLADAVQVLWSSDPDAPYDGERAHADMFDLCPRLKGERQAVRQAGEAGALAHLRFDDVNAALGALASAGWPDERASAFVDTYLSLRPGRPRDAARDTFGSSGHATTRSVVRPRLADYTWAELKVISRAIESAGGDAEGLAIAREHNLVDGDGRLLGDEKPVTLEDGTKASVRVAGFRHDELVFGGVAGITFEFAGVSVGHSMNDELTNAGGWRSSAMRAWLNSDFLELLPEDLRTCVEPAKKRTNNRGHVWEADTSRVTETADSLWLLSMTEVYGRLSPQSGNASWPQKENEVWLTPWSSATYDAEGTQYQLYSDQGVTMSDYGFCKKSRAKSWWLRSPGASYSGGFRYVGADGVWGYDYADGINGVSPGFCL